MEHRQRFVYEKESWKKGINDAIERNEKIIETMNSKIDDEIKVIDRIEERYIESKISKEKVNELEMKHHNVILESKQTKKKAEEEIRKLIFDRDNTETKIDYDKLDIKQRIDLVRKCIKKIIIERQNRFIVNLEIQMTWVAVWDFRINTREKKVLSFYPRYNRNILYPPKNEES